MVHQSQRKEEKQELILLRYHLQEQSNHLSNCHQKNKNLNSNKTRMTERKNLNKELLLELSGSQFQKSNTWRKVMGSVEHSDLHHQIQNSVIVKEVIIGC